MRIKAKAVIITIGVIVALTFHFTALAVTDAPHNGSNNIDCGSCHGVGLLNSPFWGGTMSYDQLCLNCHKASSGPYSETNAPLVVTHSSETTSDKYSEWERECRDCHNPHYQRQKLYKNTDANNLYLATGTITNCVYNGDNTSTLTYSTITYKTGWDAAKLTEKTSGYRRAILFPNINKLGYNYPITAVDPDAKTIKVTGNVTTYLYPPTTFAAIYGQFIKDAIDVNGTNTQVKFFDRKGTKSYADGDTTYNGVCEVCHTQTMYHKNDGTGNYHYPGARCYVCHAHINGFGYAHGESGSDCDDCHGHDDGWNGGDYYGTTQSHSTHTENDSDDLKGPNITCSDCHDTDDYPFFKSGTDEDADGKYNLSETDVCDNCHSPNGAFDGVNNPTYGAKANWTEGVYASPTLKSGKDKWCAGCHDDEPAYSRKETIEIIVDNHEAAFVGTWPVSVVAGNYYGYDYQYHVAGDGSNTATWTPNIPETDDYNVYAWWNSYRGKATNAPYLISYNGGSEIKEVTQKSRSATWTYFGTYNFTTGVTGYIQLSDNANDSVVADAVKVANGTFAPNVVGDNSTYGFYVTGHKINCLNCHDAIKKHIDNLQRTYDVDEDTSAVNHSYCDSYRLSEVGNKPAMVIPRASTDPRTSWADFALCFDCHNRNDLLVQPIPSDLTEPHTNFWDSEASTYIGNAHEYHLSFGYRFDSDWDHVLDSTPSCVTCHNVHGSPSKVMIRHGELISTPGTTDKVPALNFMYLVPWTIPPATATWTSPSLAGGNYDVYAWLPSDAVDNHARDALYVVSHDGPAPNPSQVTIDQRQDGGVWAHLGNYAYNSGSIGSVVLDNSFDKTLADVVVADAVRWDNGAGDDVIVDNPDATFSPDSLWLTWNTAPAVWNYIGDDFRYTGPQQPIPDPDATLLDSVGGWMQHNGTGVTQTHVCSTCHGPDSRAKYLRDPYSGPKVVMPKAEPDSVANDGTGSSLITVTILDPDDNVTSVTIDLSSIGGSSSQAMNDNGDGTYSYQIDITAGTPDRFNYVFEITATDADMLTGENQATLSVIEPGAIYIDDPQAIFIPDCILPCDPFIEWDFYSTPEQFGTGFRYKDIGDGTGTATWTPLIPQTGQYQVYAWWDDCHTIGDSQKRRSQHVPYTVYYDGGSQRVEVDQTDTGPGGGKWNLLGTWQFTAGNSGYVVLSDDATPAPVPGSTTWVVGDAIKLVPAP
jgi:hypothetical protein